MKFSRLNPALIDRGYISTPRRVGGKVLEICRRVVEEPAPKLVPIRPAKGATFSRCYFNVRDHVERLGGEMVFGWAVWEWPSVFVEMEHHCVWSMDGEWIDVTPQQYRADEVLFLPDPQRTYNFATEERIESIRIPTRKSVHIDDWLEATGLRMGIENSIPFGVTRELSMEESAFYNGCVKRARQAKAAILVELANRTMPSDPCVCGSGRKFAKCCIANFG